jgi:hypothetical protein
MAAVILPTRPGCAAIPLGKYGLAWESFAYRLGTYCSVTVELQKKFQ